MEKKEYLTEENYQKGKKKVTKIALIVLIVGILIGASIITVGLIKQGKVNSQYSEKNKAEMQLQLEKEKQKIIEQVEAEKPNLIKTKEEIEEKIQPIEDQIKSLKREPFTGFDDAYYARKDKIEELEKSMTDDKNSLSVIDKALDESFNHCQFGEAKNNNYTSKYCSLKNQLSEKSMSLDNLDREFSDFNKDFDSFDSIPFYMIGGFIIFASCIAAGSIYMIAKRREILAFTTQQVMPVAQEGIEKMTPTVVNSTKEIAKGLAQGITEGIKEGKKEDKQ